MSEIIKTFETNDIKIIHEQDTILFCGKDVAIALGYADTDQAIRKNVEDEDKLIPSAGRVELSMKGCPIFINECGVYSLIFSSKMPAAKRFKKWVFTEVLPSIRKTGGYAKFVTRHNQLCIRNETDLHYEVVKEIRKRFPNFVLTVPGGELQDTAEKRIDMYKKGFKGGMPDIMIMNPHRFYNGMCIELKTPGGTGVLSNKQRDTLDRYNRMGWKTIVCDDLVSAVLELLEYSKGIRVICQYCKKSRRLFKTTETLGRHLKYFHKHD